MPTQSQVLDFWGNARQAGYSDDEIRSYMLQRGWVQETPPVLANIDERQRLGLPVAITPQEESSFGERLLESFRGGAEQMYGAYKSILGSAMRLGSGLSTVPDAAEDLGARLQRESAEHQERGSELRSEALAPDVDTFFRRTALQSAGAAGEIADIVVPFEYAPRLVGRGLTKAGERFLFKGIGDDLARGMVEGLQQGTLEESLRISEAVQAANVQDVLLRKARAEPVSIGVEIVTRGREASDAARIAHTNRVTRLTEEYHNNLERLESLFPPDVGRARVGEKVVPADEASFLDVGIQLDDPATIAGTRVERVVGAPEPPVGVVPSVKTVSEYTPPGPVNDRLALGASVLERGYIRQLAEVELAHEAVQEIIGKNVSARLNRLNIGQWEVEMRKHLKATEDRLRTTLAETGNTGILYKKAREAMERAYRSTLEGSSSSVASRQFLGRIAQEKSRQAYLLPDVAPAEMYDDRISSGFWRWLAERGRRAVDPFRGGNAAGFQEGLAFRTARRYKDPDVQRFVRDYIPERAERTSGEIALLNYRREQHRRNVSAAISRYSRRSGQSVEEIGELLKRARNAGDPFLVPDAELRNALRDAGGFIDDLSRRYVDEGVVGADEVDKFRENLGKYLHTSYASMHVKDWAKHVKETARWESAYRWFRETWPDMSEEEIMGTMLRLVERPKDVVRGRTGLDAVRGDLPKPVFDELKHRTDLPDELRELFGVSKDFVLDFDISAAKMIYSLEWSAFQRDILVEGLRNGTISRNAPKAASVAGGNVRKIPLGQISEDVSYYVSSELGDLLGIVNASLEKNQQFILPLLNGIAKLNKTVGSPSAQLRNMWSWPFMWIQAGVLGVRHPVRSARAWNLARKVFTQKVFKSGKLSREELALVERAHQLGLMETGVASGTQDIWLEQLNRAWRADTAETLGRVGRGARRIATPTAVSVGRLAKKALGIDVLMRAYRSTDSVGKLVGWLVRRDQLKALVKTPDDVAYLVRRYGSADIDEAAANFVKDTLQHFPRTPAIGRKLAKNPFVGTFVSFQVEMLRNLSNTLRYLGADLAHSKELLARGDAAGAARWSAHAMSGLAALITSQLAWKAAQAHFNGVHGIDKRTEEAIRRRLLAPWAENNDYIVSDMTAEGVTLTDTGYSNPYQVASSLINAALVRPGDLSERLVNVAKELEDVFLGREIFAAAALGAVQNRQTPESGIISATIEGRAERPIAKAADPYQAWERAYWFLKRTAPGVFVSTDRIIEAASGERAFGTLPQKRRAMEYPVWQEVLAMFGMPRVAQYNKRESLGFHYRDTWDRKEDLRKAFVTRYLDNPTPKTITNYAARWDEMQEDLLLLVDDSYALGLSRRDIEDLLEQSKFSQDAARRLARLEKVDFLEMFKLPEPR